MIDRRVVQSLIVGCTLLAFGYWWPAFANLTATGFGDWQMVHHNWEVGRVAVERYHEWPVFDPYHCGGVSILGNPESQIFSPLFPLSFVVGTTIATKIFLVVHTAIALLGMLAYARRILGASWQASLLAAVVFAGSGFFAWHCAGGHATFASFAFLPLLHLWLREGEKRTAPVIAAGSLLAVAIAEGGTYPYPYMLISLGLASLVRLVESPAEGIRSLRALATSTLISVGFAAFRLVPIAATLTRVPRTIGSVDRTPLAELAMMLTARDHEWHVPGHEFVWPEYATYVGIPVLVLVGIGIARAGSRRTRALVVAHVVLGFAVALLIAGNASDMYPWPLMRRLPVFDSLRVPSRFLVVLTFHLGVLAAIGLDAIDPRRFARGRLALGILASLVVIGVATDIVIVTRPIVNRWDRPPIDESLVAEERFYRNVPYDAVYASLPARNESTTACYVGGMNWPVSPSLRVGRVPFARSNDADAVLELVRETAASHRIRYRSTRPVRVVLNQNFDPAFRSTLGSVVEQDGLLAVDLPAGSRTFDVAYDARDGLVGLGVSLASVIGVVLSVRAVRTARTGRSRRRSPRPIAIRDPGLVRAAVIAIVVIAYTALAYWATPIQLRVSSERVPRLTSKNSAGLLPPPTSASAAPRFTQSPTRTTIVPRPA